MKLDFRIEWGYHFLYSNFNYHDEMIWDGRLTVDRGEIRETYLLEYPRPNIHLHFGPGLCAKETPLAAPQWESRTCNWIAGVHFLAKAEEDAIFHLQAGEHTLCFSAAELQKEGRLTFPVGPKYLNCAIIINLTDCLWFRPAPKAGEREIAIDDLHLPVRHWARMKMAWLSPDSAAEWTDTIPQKDADYCEQLLHIAAMAVPLEFTDDETDQQLRAHYTLGLYCDGTLIKEFSRYYRNHDADMQLLEDDWVRFCAPEGTHRFALKIHSSEGDLGPKRIRSEKNSLAISLLRIKTCRYAHGQLSIPDWALKGEILFGKVFAAREETLKINGLALDCKIGWNEFPIPTAEAGTFEYRCGDHTASIEIYDIPEEQIPLRIGYDMTVVPHDDNGYMDWLLDYTARTRLGNFIMFRSFTPGTKEESYRRWGAFCREHGIYAANCRDTYQSALGEALGEYLVDQGKHEYAGRTYIAEPGEGYASESMKEAAEHFTAYMKAEIDKTREYAPRVAFGDPSGAVKYSFLAGADSVRAETLAGFTTPLLAATRAAAESLGKGDWSVHVAIQHNHQLYHENHLGMYFLGLMQPWMMGANGIYEEDSLFELFKEERQTWDDALTKGKREMTRNFFKFAKTHPRQGKCIRTIAALEGRYAIAPNGALCFGFQDHKCKVWGAFGKDHPTWQFGQPEKGNHLLDVLMPGCTLLPLHQKPELRRFFFTGAPYGDIDKTPIEASGDYLQQYKLILNLCWHTANAEDTKKLTAYVQKGGVLLSGLPQFSTHMDREFLADMKDLALINDGDLSSTCGFKVLGKGTKFSGEWESNIDLPSPTLSALPNESPDEDGDLSLAEIELTGGEVLAWDKESKQPLLIRNQCGKGYFYTFTFWAYPGHEQAQEFCAAWVAKLAEEAQGEIQVEDPSKEVFWTVWQEGEKTVVYLINTDWSAKGNTKKITLWHGGEPLSLEIRERELTVVTFSENAKVETFTL